jgi:predicted nucleotidyltransferase
MTLRTDEVLGILGAHGPELRRLGATRLGLFGSTVRGDAREDSDLDFLVELDRKTFDSYMDLKVFLEDLFHRPIDLVLSDALKPRLRASILSEVRYVPGL